MSDLRSDLCKKCIHTKVCMKDKNVCGDVFVPGNPMFFDNNKLWKEYEERKAKGFPCVDFVDENIVPKWIPVKARLPEPKFAREWYLVHLESGCIKTLAFEKSGTPNNLFKDGWHETASRITHWMPLPTPPKGGEA